MKITVETDSGKIVVYENVIDYGIIDKEEIEATCEANGVKLTDEIIREVKRQCSEADHLLCYDDLADIILGFRE